MGHSVTLSGPNVFPGKIFRPVSGQRWMKMPLPLLDQEFIYPKELGDFCDFLSFLQDRRNRLLIESIVVVSLESHVGSFNGRFRPIPSAIKSRQTTPPVRIASRPTFGLH